MPKQEDKRKAVHGEKKWTIGIKKLSEKKEDELTTRPLQALCSSCGKSITMKNVGGIFDPSDCANCGGLIVNVYASEQTGVLIAWVE
jgi:predicted RNA-binding Zn-ribbon protein involved in translation (DUF1610 family)